MKVYHGSLEQVPAPEIRKPNRRLDYGPGFYATTSLQQAEKWVRQRIDDEGADMGYVNVYELDEEFLTTLNTLIFNGPSNEWAEFVMANRTKKNFVHNYDIVYGPVANDRVFFQFGLYEAGAISVETLIRELKTYKLVDQYLFHTEKSLECLKYVELIKVKK